MSLKTLAPQILTSPALRSLARGWRAAGRRLTGKPRTLHAFLEPKEPYSDLLRQAAPALAKRYGLTLETHAVSAPDRSAAPEPERLAAFAAQDARALAEHYGLNGEVSETASPGDTAEGDRLRALWGHYAGGMLYFEGEWYWGLDRIHHLERRLGASEDALLFPPPEEAETAEPGGEIEVFLSLRSPYSYIAAMRMFGVARRWEAKIVLRPVLPMVMRALPVPRAKRFYIVRDAKREAERFGLAFGKIVDPVGPGVERGLALLHRAIPEGKGEAFLQSYMRGVWSEGVETASGPGLSRLAGRAGLSPRFVEDALADESWREAVEANREALFGGGLWGVPSFKVGERFTFGQDRLWRVGRWLNGLD